jgi:hypothetical protein
MTAPTGVDARAGWLADVLSDIEDEIRKAEGTVLAIARGVSAVLDQLPGYAVDDVRVSMADLQRLFAQETAKLRELLAYAGDDTALLAAGSTWSSRIGGGAADLAGHSTLNGVRADDHWTGIAAEAYRNTLPAQEKALTAIKAAADEIDATLTEFANAILIFWTSIYRSLIALGFGLATAATAAFTGVGSGLGLALAVATVVVFGTEISSAVGAFTDLVTNAETRSGELDRRLSNDVAFPSGAWPRSTTPITGDGSTTDGDDTDWRLK